MDSTQDMDTASIPVTQIAPGLHCLTAPNPSPMTYLGTNTWTLGQAELCIIDPGPDDPRHLSALLQAIAGRTVSHIIVTHSHLDHCALAPALARETGAPVLGYGRHASGRSAVMTRWAQAGALPDGGEGADWAFVPDRYLSDGEVITGAGWDLQVLHTPGHCGNHIALQAGDAVFCGDLVMGWASTLIAPPDGDVQDFLASCLRLRALGAARLYPGHGPVISDPTGRIDWLVAHRQSREAQIIAALRDGPMTIAGLTGLIYTDTPPALMQAASRSILAHLIDLQDRNRLIPADNLHPDRHFHLA